MKQTAPQKTKIVLQLLLFIGVVLVTGLLKPHAVPFSPATVSFPLSKLTPTQSTPSHATLTNTVSKTNHHAVASLSPKFDEIQQTVQHEYVYHMLATPNDPSYATNWALAKVNAPNAWSVATGNGQTVVAVIDTGFGLNHEDLVNQWYTNSGETGMTQAGDRCWTGTPADKSANNCDDDNNGYIDDWRGWSFVSGDNNPQAGRTHSTGAGTSHGTEVAGIVGATSNNGTGVTALDWNTKIMPLQVLDDDGMGYTSDVTAAVYYAVDNGADVINMSLGSYANDPAMKIAVDYASAHNVIVVAAAGNCGDGTDPSCSGFPVGTISYPAAYPDAIAVGATTSTDQRASFSSYGPALDVVAPGYNVPSSTAWASTNQTSLYSGGLYGTSFASPMVASLAALIKSIRPSTSIADVAALIEATATKTASMSGVIYTTQLGHGVIDANAALTIATILNANVSSTPTLLQAGSAISEHTMLSGNTLSSGCQATVGSACTVQLKDDAGDPRYLPYATIQTSGAAGWTWSSDMLGIGYWELRSQSGDSISTTPYLLFKKG